MLGSYIFPILAFFNDPRRLVDVVNIAYDTLIVTTSPSFKLPRYMVLDKIKG
jgi:hypothetical protein